MMKVNSPEYRQATIDQKLFAILEEVNDGLATSPAYIASMIEEIHKVFNEDKSHRA